MGLDTGQWEPPGSPVDRAESLELGRWTAKAVGMASITACHPAGWQLQQPWLTTCAGSYQRSMASDPYGRQHPADCSSIPTVKSYSLTNRRQEKDLQEARQDKVSNS